jgi:hypothetical protein
VSREKLKKNSAENNNWEDKELMSKSPLCGVDQKLKFLFMTVRNLHSHYLHFN